MVKMKRALALLPLAVCFSSTHVLAAASTSDLEKRLDEQEKKITRLENRLKGTRSAVKENRSRIADQNERLKINGFLSAGVATNDGDAAVEPTYKIGDAYSTAAVNKMGVQMTFAVSQKMSATLQMVEKGTNNYNIDAEWAYLSYDLTKDLTFRLGRNRIPYYLLSEYLDVGYAYPWVRPPIEMYNIPVSSVDGLSFIYNKQIGELGLTWQGYGGSTSGYSDQLQGSFTLNQAWGSALSAEYGNFTFRLSYNQAHLDVTGVDSGGIGQQEIDGINQIIAGGNLLGVPQTITPVALKNIRTRYISAAAMYDNGSLLLMSEIANLQVDGNVQPAGDGGYFTIGYRFGKWMPHVTFAKFYTDSYHDKQTNAIADYVDNVLAKYYALFSGSAAQDAALVLRNSMVALNQQQQSYTLGLTYDISPRVKAKLEATHYEDFGTYKYATHTAGSNSLDFQTWNGTGRFAPASNAAGTQPFTSYGVGSHTAIYSFSVDAVF